jgi:hypothetical protein
VLILKRQWTRQPQIAVELDRSNPITRQLAFAVIHAALPLYNVAKNANGDVTTSTLYANGPGGVGIAVSSPGAVPAATFAGNIVTSNGSGTGDFTFASYASPASTASATHALLSQATGASQQGYLLANTNASYAASAGWIAFGSVSGLIGAASACDGLAHLFVGVRSGTTHFIDRDGVELVTGTKTAGSITGAAPEIYVGGIKTYSQYGRAGPIHYMSLAWDRALSPQERVSIGANPWQLFAPRRIYIPTASAAASTYTLSAATYAPGSITASGVTPRVTVTVA